MFCKLNKEGLSDYPSLAMRYLKIKEELGETIIATYNGENYFINKSQIEYVSEFDKSTKNDCGPTSGEKEADLSNA